MVRVSGVTIYHYKTEKTSTEILVRLKIIERSQKESKKKPKCVLLYHKENNDIVLGACTYTIDPDDPNKKPTNLDYIIFPKYKKIVIVISNNNKSRIIAETLIASIEYKQNADDYFAKLVIPKESMFRVFKKLQKEVKGVFMKTAIFLFEEESLVDIERQYTEEEYGKLSYSLSKDRSAEKAGRFDALFEDSSKFQMDLGVATIPNITYLENDEVTYNLLHFSFHGRIKIGRDIEAPAWIKFFERHLIDFLKQD